MTTVELQTRSTLRVPAEISSPPQFATCAQSWDGKILAAAGSSPEVFLWDSRSEAFVKAIGLPAFANAKAVRQLEFVPNTEVGWHSQHQPLFLS